MIITIDGPAGAGKSTVARLLAVRLSEQTGRVFEYLDTGSMYRAVTLLGIRQNTDWHNPAQLENLVQNADLHIFNGRTFLDGEDVTESVRTPNITKLSRFAADNPAIRHIMVAQQRNIAEKFLAESRGLVTEGRDQGTAVFPEAACKFFLTASPEERTRRRLGELQRQEITGDFDEIYRQITERDARDAAREIGPLCEPADARRIVSDDMPIDEVVNRIAAICAMQMN